MDPRPPNRHGCPAAVDGAAVKAGLIVRIKGEIGTDWIRKNAYGPCPCEGCEDRTIGCHASCKKYKDYREKADEIKAKLEEERKIFEYKRSVVLDYWGNKWRGRRRK